MEWLGDVTNTVKDVSKQLGINEITDPLKKGIGSVLNSIGNFGQEILNFYSGVFKGLLRILGGVGGFFEQNGLMILCLTVVFLGGVYAYVQPDFATVTSNPYSAMRMAI
jgi:hypothetical protein